MKQYPLLAALALCLGLFSTASTQAQTNNNIIYACYHKENGQLRKVSGPGQCKNSEIPVSWNVAGVPGPTGPQGPKGDKGDKGEPGQAVTSQVIPLGDARCPNGVGGVQYTDSTGVRVVCNGQQGERGEKGEKGDPGPAASGFLTGNIKNLPPPEINNFGYAAPTGITNLSLTPNMFKEDAWTLSPSETVVFRDFRIRLTKPAANLYVFIFLAYLPDNNNVAVDTFCNVQVGESGCTGLMPTGPVLPGSKLVIHVINTGETPDTVDALFSLRATAP